LRTSNDLRYSTKMNLKNVYAGQKTHNKMGLEYVEPLPLLVSKVTGAQKRMESSLKIKKIKVTVCKMQNITKKSAIMHINIIIQIEGIGTITTIKEIKIYLILNGQIKFILEIPMIGFMN
jgi:hypothetical protein